MARQERNRMMLNTVDFKPAVFTPLERKPLDYDMGLLERSFALQDERKTKTEAQIASFKEATSKLRSQLHSSELAEFDTKIKELENNVNNSIAVGDYQGALNRSIHIAGDLISNPETIAKIKTNLEYEEGMKYLQTLKDNKKLSELDYEYLKDKNKYNFQPEVDSEGNIIGGKKWELSDIVTDFNPVEFLDFAITHTKPKKGSSSNIYNIDKNTKEISDTTTKESNAYEQLPVEELRSNAKAYYKSHPDAEAGAIQRYEAYKWKRNKLNNIKNTRDLTESEQAELNHIIDVLGNDINQFKSNLLFDNDMFRHASYYIRHEDNSVIKEVPKNNESNIPPGYEYSNSYTMGNQTYDVHISTDNNNDKKIIIVPRGEGTLK